MRAAGFRNGFLLSLVVCGLASSFGRTAEPAQRKVDFNRQVRPILSEHCFACHGPDEKTRKAKLRLDLKEGMFGPLRSGGVALKPGQPANSELFARISSTDPDTVMPPPKFNKKLTPDQVQIIKKWVEQGAHWSEHWAFVPPRRSPLPRVRNATWPRNPIDRFILARLKKEGLRASQEADRATLIRRVTLDLTGLPPTLAEVDAFLTDSSPEAYENVVDRLLRSSRFGEHQARYWLDAARYGDTHGLHLDNYREIWPYRNWVIKAINDNKPFDQFLIEQLAGDLLPNPTVDQIVATGFNRCHVSTSEGGSIEEEVYVRNVVDQVDTNGMVLLGLSTGCARCHDHKYDPIRMKDYYQLFAFFNSIDGRPLDGNIARHEPVLSLTNAEQTAALARLDKKIGELRQKISSELARVKYDETNEAKELPRISLVAAAGTIGVFAQSTAGKAGMTTLTAWLRDKEANQGAGLPRELKQILKVEQAKRSDAQRKQLRDYFLEFAYPPTRPTFERFHGPLAALEKERAELDRGIPATLIFKERKEPRPAYMLKRGEYDQRGPQVGRDTPAFLPPLPADAPRNRLGFARWLVAPGHPLTARVAVNRFWQQVFGTGIVKTAEDFGSQGEPPSHPELLDWLAVYFIEEGWDVKRTLRRLVTSATYRQSSKITPDRLTRDPANRSLARGPRFRLDAEMLRDQALAVSGLLVEHLGGPSVKPPQPAGLWEAVGYVTSNTAHFTADTGCDKVHRRSLYTFWKRTAAPPQMNAFDAPSREACTIRRERTNTPLQALLLLNETQYVEAARALAQRVLRETSANSEDRLTHLFRLAIARKPDTMEMGELLSAYKEYLAVYQRDSRAAHELISLGESKHDTKLDSAELAAWTMIANTVLNLDEVLNKG